MLGRRLRAFLLFVGVAATVLMAVLGCTHVTTGTLRVDQLDAPAFRTSAAASRSAAAVTSSAREAQHQAVLATQAVYSVCETLSTSSATAVNNLNTYVQAAYSGGDLAGTKGPAVDALNSSADGVERDIKDTLPADVKAAMKAWIDAARSTAAALVTDSSPEQFNAAVAQVNSARDPALALCDASY